MMFKKGDRVLCKLDYSNFGPVFEKGKYYTIDRVETSAYYVTSDSKSIICLRIESDEDVNPYLIWFKDIFYTENEVRKLKLDDVQKRG